MITQLVRAYWKRRLHRAVKRYQCLTHPEVLRLSQRLDAWILRTQHAILLHHKNPLL